MGTGEVLGGVLSPSLAGLAADAWGLGAPLWIMFGLCASPPACSLSGSKRPRRACSGTAGRIRVMGARWLDPFAIRAGRVTIA